MGVGAVGGAAQGREKREQVSSLSDLLSFWSLRNSLQNAALRGLEDTGCFVSGVSTDTDRVPSAKSGPRPERGSLTRWALCSENEQGKGGRRLQPTPRSREGL